MMKQLIFFLFFFNSLSAEVSLKVNRNTVKLNESITAVFTSTDNIKEQPDFSPLERDFDIVTRNQASTTRFTNGKVDQEISWTLSLMSKKEGSVTIPPIRFDQFQTAETVIQVTPAVKASKSDPIYFEVEASPSKDAYELSQIIYTLRFFRSVNLTGNINEVHVNDPDAIVERLGGDKEYEQTNNGSRYLVLERKYAVFPFHAGELTFAPAVFEGQVITNGRALFNSQAQYKRLASDPLTISVKPIPLPFTKKDWLAAYDVQLTDEWSADVANIQVGDAITRTITIAADGCLASQIPQIAFNLPAELKQYQDKPQTTNQTTVNGNKGISSMKVALIASKAGTITMPKITVKWWDLKANMLRETALPELQLHVVDSAIAEAKVPIAEELSAPISESAPADLPTWIYLLIGFNGVLIVVIAVLIAKNRKPATKQPKEKNKDEKSSASQIKQNIKKACALNDAKAAEKQLLLWAKMTFPHDKPLNLATIKDFVSIELQEKIEELNQSLYSSQFPWNGQELWRIFNTSKLPKDKADKKPSSDLRNLYN